MESGTEFERLLDRHLQLRSSVESAAVPAVDGRPNPALLFAMWGGGVPPLGASCWNRARAAHRPFPPCRKVASPVATVVAAAAHITTAARQPVEPLRATRIVAETARRAPHRLTPHERSAVDLLRSAGADLSDDFTPDELRTAYRRLAFRLHPDQHPAASVAEHRRLAASFGAVSGAYRRLSAVVKVGSDPRFS